MCMFAVSCSLMLQQYLRLCASADVSGNIQRSVDGSVPIEAERWGSTRRPLRANSGVVVADPLGWKVPVSKSWLNIEEVGGKQALVGELILMHRSCGYKSVWFGQTETDGLRDAGHWHVVLLFIDVSFWSLSVWDPSAPRSWFMFRFWFFLHEHSILTLEFSCIFKF